MSHIWNKLIECKDEIITIFDEQATEINEPGLDYFNRPDGGWINRVWANDNVRRAHIDVVDARESKGTAGRNPFPYGRTLPKMPTIPRKNGSISKVGR